MAAFWQGLPKLIRSQLTSTPRQRSSSDYSGCHVRMLAAELGVDLGAGDIYEVTGWPRHQVKSRCWC